MEDLVLSIEDLTIGFDYQGRPFNAVENANIELHAGSSLGIVGESGSGKSLTARSILNLLPQNAILKSGQIHLKEKDGGFINILRAPIFALERIRGDSVSMIFQEPMTSLNPVYRCGNQVTENIRKHTHSTAKEAKAKAISLFEEVKLPSPERIFKSYPHELSGGQRQRVMIAMALSCQPKILIADEPTTALDVTVQKSILDLLKSLQKKYRMSLIFISHDLGVISEVADNVAVMYQGRIVEQGLLSQIIDNPQSSYTKGLIACRPSVHSKPFRLPTLSQFIEDKTNKEPDTASTKVVSSKTQEKPGVLFELHNIDKAFPLQKNFFGKTTKAFKAIDDITLKVYRGETLGLVGESGSGKTTLGRILMNLLPFDNGQIYYKQSKVSGLKKSALTNFRQNVQIIFQDPYSSLNPKMSVGQIIEEPIRYHGIIKNKQQRKHKVTELLQNVRLDESYYYRFPHELSGGERQRVAIARVLGLNPEFIICDEAVSALDVSIQAEILNLLQELKEKYHLTYVFISHDFSVIRFMADRVAVMKDGRLIELSEADQLFKSAQNAYTQDLLSSVPDF
jgi:peptide/nickel transport system ATP-binding protein